MSYTGADSALSDHLVHFITLRNNYLIAGTIKSAIEVAFPAELMCTLDDCLYWFTKEISSPCDRRGVITAGSLVGGAVARGGRLVRHGVVVERSPVHEGRKRTVAQTTTSQALPEDRKASTFSQPERLRHSAAMITSRVSISLRFQPAPQAGLILE